MGFTTNEIMAFGLGAALTVIGVLTYSVFSLRSKVEAQSKRKDDLDPSQSIKVKEQKENTRFWNVAMKESLKKNPTQPSRPQGTPNNYLYALIEDGAWEKSVYTRQMVFVGTTATCTLRDIANRVVQPNSEQCLVLHCKLVYMKEGRMNFKVEDVYAETTFVVDPNQIPIPEDDFGEFMGKIVVFNGIVTSDYNFHVSQIRRTRFRKEVI